MSLKNALNNMKKSMESGNFKGSDGRVVKNKAAIVMSNQTPAIKKFNYTSEQQEIIESDYESLSVRAFSGAGKTSTLEGYAARRTGKKGLYIAFNRSIKEEAARKFPKNVKCVTSHGLAYAKFGNELKHKLMGYTDWKDVYDVAKIKKPFKDVDLYNRIYATLLSDTINIFNNTADVTINKNHIAPETYYYLKKNKTLSSYLPAEDKIIADAMLLWQSMIDPNKTEIRATHDTYLKLYQLSEPSLNYDYILLDEAQDSNPALLDIFSRQETGKVLVGDPYQSIYGFRNAIDAMNKIKTQHTLDLTMSFRFGEQIADFANSVLALRGETKQILGMKDYDLVYYGKPVEEKGNVAFIGRYNSTLLRDSIEYIGMKSDPIYFSGGFESLKPGLLLDLYNLKYKTGFIKDIMLASFKSYENFIDVITETNDIEWLGRSKLVEEYGFRLPGIIDQIKRRETTNINGAGKIYSTAHKSKGLEFEHVILAGDYYSTPMDEGAVPEKLSDKPLGDLNEELHIFYVAATRAKKTLNVPENYRSYYMDFNKMVNKELFDFNKKNKIYPILNKNEKFIQQLIKEREKSVDFYKSKKKKEDNVNPLSEDDIFA